MNLQSSRSFPICYGRASEIFFPYATQFNSTQFTYLECAYFSSVFVDPVPDEQKFVKMYAKTNYHDCYYEEKEGVAYSESAHLLRQYLPINSRVLDYGCGIGGFLKALAFEGFTPYGVEFDQEAAKSASQNANCEVWPVDRFWALSAEPIFDVVHLGDVLEHLPDPVIITKRLLDHLKYDGLLFVEGPLEVNLSPVYWSARLFGAFKRIFRPNFVGSHSPTHLFRTSAKQQLAFFQHTEPRLELISWTVYETGWPYAYGGLVKRIISAIALFMGGKRLFGVTFGNRFRSVFRYRESVASVIDLRSK